MVHQIVHARLDALRRAEVDSVLLAHFFNLLVVAREAYEARVEFREVGAQDVGGVAGWVAGDEEGEEVGAVLGLCDGGGGRGGEVRGCLVDAADDVGHLVELFGTDVGAVREAEVDLEKGFFSW